MNSLALLTYPTMIHNRALDITTRFSQRLEQQRNIPAWFLIGSEQITQVVYNRMADLNGGWTVLDYWSVHYNKLKAGWPLMACHILLKQRQARGVLAAPFTPTRIDIIKWIWKQRKLGCNQRTLAMHLGTPYIPLKHGQLHQIDRHFAAATWLDWPYSTCTRIIFNQTIVQ